MLLSSAIVLYWLGLHLTKPSPFIRTSTWQIVVAGAYGVALAALFALALAVVARVVDRVAGLAIRSQRLGTVTAKTLLASTLILLFVDNILYTVAGASLRSENGSPAKLAFLVLALAPGLLWGRARSRPSATLVKTVVISTALLSTASAVVIAIYLGDEEQPPALTRVGGDGAENVLILSSDGLNAKDMEVYTGEGDTTPFMTSIADELLIFENGFTNNGNTTGSITSMMTGRSPVETGVVYPPDALQQNDARMTLPYLLGREGYRRTSWSVPHYVDARSQNLVDAFELDNGEEQPLVGALPLGSGPARWFVEDLTTWSVGLWKDALWIDELVNPYDFVVAHRGNVADEARLDGIDREISSGQPFFITSHFLVSHGPFFPLPDGRIAEEQTEIWDRDYYEEAIRVFDGYVREVFADLERAGKLDSTIVIITSDHGEVFDARQRVPLMIRFPSGEPSGREDVNAQRLDVAPTVLHALGFEAPDFMQGMDLAEPDVIPDRRGVIAMTEPERAPRVVLGYRPRSDELIRTDIVCREYKQTRGGKVVDSGSVDGSTSPCRDQP